MKRYIQFEPTFMMMNMPKEDFDNFAKIVQESFDLDKEEFVCEGPEQYQTGCYFKGKQCSQVKLGRRESFLKLRIGDEF